MSGYDPFAYGQVKFGSDNSGSATPDDILFEDAGPAPKATFGVEDNASDWELPENPNASDLSGMAMASADAVADFGADMLGERGSEDARPKAKPQPAAAPRRPSLGGMPGGGPGGAPANARPERLPSKRISTKPLARPPQRKHLGLLGIMMPGLCIAAGGSGAAWFYLVQQNVVMTAIAGATGLVAAAFMRLLFK